jgi:hypothetical protein
MEDPKLATLDRVVVVVDLDRPRPDTVVETLEAIKLFLSVKTNQTGIRAVESAVAGMDVHVDVVDVRDSFE